MEAESQIHSSPCFSLTYKGLVERKKKQIPSTVNGAQLIIWCKPNIWENSALKT
jgi:hypothetical protein